MSLAFHRYPWTAADEALLIRRKRCGVRHKAIARELRRTPRSIDQHIARLKGRGLLERMTREMNGRALEKHDREETALLKKLLIEAGE